MGAALVGKDAIARRAVGDGRSHFLPVEPRDAATGPRCGNCGCLVGTAGTAVKRGAVVVLRDPIRVLWRRRYVPLSPAESAVFAVVAAKGRATFGEIDAAMDRIGAKRANRGVILYRIRRKFEALGGKDPFVRRAHGLTIALEPDEADSMAVVIGMPQAAYEDIC